ncbi:uncharacterized protein LOC118205790, partial [Stegodyphus dumicola]|uniref:uncharacterized protein LOC118205790 n=1 Tax=Stegodyphus dumicola TaxID=202533 RepID=UPI0015A7D264
NMRPTIYMLTGAVTDCDPLPSTDPIFSDSSESEESAEPAGNMEGDDYDDLDRNRRRRGEGDEYEELEPKNTSQEMGDDKLKQRAPAMLENEVFNVAQLLMEASEPRKNCTLQDYIMYFKQVVECGKIRMTLTSDETFENCSQADVESSWKAMSLCLMEEKLNKLPCIISDKNQTEVLRLK